MPDFLVSVDGPGDVSAFKQALLARAIPFRKAPADWVLEVEPDGPADATYFVVESESEDVVYLAISRAARDEQWPQGPPWIRVLANRQPPLYPA